MNFIPRHPGMGAGSPAPTTETTVTDVTKAGAKVDTATNAPLLFADFVKHFDQVRKDGRKGRDGDGDGQKDEGRRAGAGVVGAGAVGAAAGGALGSLVGRRLGRGAAASAGRAAALGEAKRALRLARADVREFRGLDRLSGGRARGFMDEAPKGPRMTRLSDRRGWVDDFKSTPEPLPNHPWRSRGLSTEGRRAVRNDWLSEHVGRRAIKVAGSASNQVLSRFRGRGAAIGAAAGGLLAGGGAFAANYFRPRD